MPLLMPFVKVLSTPKRGARMITKVLINASGQTGTYYDKGGHPMLGSALVRDPKFQDRVVAETHCCQGFRAKTIDARSWSPSGRIGSPIYLFYLVRLRKLTALSSRSRLPEPIRETDRRAQGITEGQEPK